MNNVASVKARLKNKGIESGKTMQEMLNDHRCKVCGTEAPEGSAPYIFMQKRLQEAISKKKGKIEKEEVEEKAPILFVNDFINPLRRHSISFYGFDTEIEQIGTTISKKIESNDKIHEKIDKKAHEIQEGKNKINEIRCRKLL